MDLSTLSPENLDRYYHIITQANSIRRHNELLAWLQGDIQYYLPHEILIAAWGDFTSKPDFLRYCLSIAWGKNRKFHPASLLPLLQGLFNRWMELGKSPFTLGVGESGFLLEGDGLQCSLGKALQAMRSLLVHGLINERSHHDCLYVIFSSGKKAA